jgi:hypothetical protein
MASPSAVASNCNTGSRRWTHRWRTRHSLRVDLARWPEQVIDGDSREFPASECLFALEVVSDDRPGKRQRDYRKATGYARGGVPVLLVIDPADRICTLLTGPRDGEYAVRRITKFGEPVIIPAAGIPVTLPTDTF